MEETKARIRLLLQTVHWTEADARWLQDYLQQGDQHALEEVATELFFSDLTETRNTLDIKLSEQWLDIIHGRMEAQPTRLKSKKWYYAAAAVFIVASATVLYIYRSNAILRYTSETTSASNKTLSQEIQPGYNQATLALADGTKISLDSTKSGILIKDEGIRYNDGTKIVASIHPPDVGHGHSSSITYNSITTPKGGQYQLTLSDGSKVWLNAASMLKYPSRFSGAEREVEISGEAFFDIAPLKDRPFKVKSRGQVVNVLGTSFNISAYDGDPSVKTTLITGAVLVSMRSESESRFIGKRLQIGQQSINSTSGMQVKTADINSVIAWKLGRFYFQNTPLESMMQQIARWYDIEVVYKDGIPNESFSGIMNRNVKLSTLLELLAETDLRFRLEGKTLTIESRTRE